MGGDVDSDYNAPGGTGGPREPRGGELWSADVENITVSALLAAGLLIAPGDWIEFEKFRTQIGSAKIDSTQIVMSTVTIDQPGVSKPWQSIMEIEEPDAALMVCSAVIEHIENLDQVDTADVWVRVE